MAEDNPEPAKLWDLTSVFIYGRLQGITRKQVARQLAELGGKLTRGALNATTVVLSHASAGTCVDALGGLRLPFRTTCDPVTSEGLFKSQLQGLATRRDHEKGPYSADDLARLSGLPMHRCRSLVAFDVLSPVEDFFAYQDLATAKQVAQLLAQNVSMPAVIRAADQLGARGLRLSQARLAGAPSGEIVQQIGHTIAGLDGQLALFVAEQTESADQCFSRAAHYEDEGDLDRAEQWYSRAEMIDSVDPVIPFNRGNALVRLARVPEAMIAFRQALRRDPEFAEAAFNLAGLYEADGRAEDALSFYGQAVNVHPTYSQAIYNQARLLTRSKRFGEALPLWNRFVEIAPDDPDVGHARRLALLCRMEIASTARQKPGIHEA